MLIITLTEQYRDYHRKAQLIAPSTLRLYVARTRAFCRHLGPNAVVADLTPQTFRRYCLDISVKFPRVVKLYRASLRHWCRWLIDEGWLNADPTEGIPLPKVATIRRVPITDEIIADMFTACDRLPSSPFRRALARGILAVMAYAGLRRGEIFNLKLGDIDFKDRCVKIDNGKGRKNRNVYPCAECFDDLRAYLRERPIDTEHGYLFLYNRAKRMGPYSLTSLIKEIKTVAGHEGVAMTPHQFRHSFASRLANHQTPLPHIQKQLGHSQLKTTAEYLHSDDSDVKATAHLGSLKPVAPPGKTETEKTASSVDDRRRFSVRRLR